MSGDAVVLLLEALFLANAVFFFGFVVIFLKTIYRFLLDLLQVVAAAEAC